VASNLKSALVENKLDLGDRLYYEIRNVIIRFNGRLDCCVSEQLVIIGLLNVLG